MATSEFNVVVTIAGRDVVISPGAIAASAKADGLEFKLDNRVELGTLAEAKVAIKNQFGVDLPDLSNMPEPFGVAFKNIMELKVAIEKLHLKTPGEVGRNKGEISRYTIGISGTLLNPIVLIKGALEVNKFMFTVSNMEDTSEPPTPQA